MGDPEPSRYITNRSLYVLYGLLRMVGVRCLKLYNDVSEDLRSVGGLTFAGRVAGGSEAVR